MIMWHLPKSTVLAKFILGVFELILGLYPMALFVGWRLAVLVVTRFRLLVCSLVHWRCQSALPMKLSLTEQEISCFGDQIQVQGWHYTEPSAMGACI